MFSKARIAILDVLSAGGDATPQELAEETGYSSRQVYRIVDDFLEKGVLRETKPQYNQRIVRVTDNPVVEAYRNLTANRGDVDWEAVLSSATIRACWYLDEPRPIATIADRLGVSRQAIQKALTPLKNRSMLAPAGPEYALADELQPLLDFTTAVVRNEHRTRARRLAPSATIAWCDPKRALVHVNPSEDTDRLQEADDWKVTGLATFQAYGLEVSPTSEPAFWYAPDEDLTPADVVCHTLLLDTDARRMSYAILLIEQERIEEESLTETASWYGLESTIPRMYRLLDEGTDATDTTDLDRPEP